MERRRGVLFGTWGVRLLTRAVLSVVNRNLPSAFRFPLSAFRLLLSAFCLPRSACCFPR
jgi:hypothetical protein